jgi:hypothetical protein
MEADGSDDIDKATEPYLNYILAKDQLNCNEKALTLKPS